MSKSINDIPALSRLVIEAGDRYISSFERLASVERGVKICNQEFINCAARASVAIKEIKEMLKGA